MAASAAARDVAAAADCVRVSVVCLCAFLSCGQGCAVVPALHYWSVPYLPEEVAPDRLCVLGGGGKLQRVLVAQSLRC